MPQQKMPLLRICTEYDVAILDILADYPTVANSVLAEWLETNNQNIAYRIRRLAEMGLIRVMYPTRTSRVVELVDPGSRPSVGQVFTVRRAGRSEWHNTQPEGEVQHEQ